MVGQKEIAQALGISNGTVSRALRNHPDLAPATRERILRKAIEMGYQRIPVRDFQFSAAKRLGVAVFDPSQRFWHSDSDGTFSGAEIYRRIIGGIQQKCQALHIEMVLEVVRPDEVPLMIRNRAIDGILLIGRPAPGVMEALRNLPAMSVSSYTATERLPRIVADNFGGMEAISNHVISLGHREILFLGAERDGLTELHRCRAKGYLSAMAGHGLAPRVVYCDGYAVAQAEEEILKSEAIICSSDGLALCLWDWFCARGKAMPRACYLAGFDGLAVSGERGWTTYAPDWEQMGGLAASFLCHHGRDLQGTGIEISVPGRLIVRD